MRKLFLIGITFIVMFTFSTLIPLAFAQYGYKPTGDQGFTLEDELKLAREKVVLSMPNNIVHQTGIPCNIWTCSNTEFFYPSIFVIGIVSSITVFVVFIKLRNSLNKTKKNIR